MAGWQLDARRFAEEVLVPVREGWDVRRNLFRFFQLPLDVRDDALVQQAVHGVDAHLKRQSLAGVHAGVASSLRPGFPELAATIRETAKRSRHREEVGQEYRAFAAQVRDAMRGMPALRPSEVEEHAARARSRLVRREVDEALAAAGIAVREPVALAVPPRPPRWADTRSGLRTLGHAGLAAYLAARGLDEGATPSDVQRARDALDRRASGEALTAEGDVLAEVGRLVAAGGLEDVLRRELVDELTETAELGPDPLAVALARAEVWRRAARLGLPSGDDLAYALLSRARPAARSEARWREELDQARAERDLRAAVALLAAQPGLPPELVELRDRLAADLARVDDGLGAAAALEVTDPEEAAARYVAVLRLAREPEAEAGLRRCPPPAPPAATARVEDGAVVVAWEPAPARAGDVRYRVERRGPAATREIAVTSGLSATDDAPPAGVRLVYRVITLRRVQESHPDGRGGPEGGLAECTPSARAAETAPVVALLPVTDLAAEAGDGEVRLRWRLPDGAVAARVVRSSDGDPVEIPAATATAFDGSARSGAHYTYAVEAAYDLAPADLAAWDHGGGRHAGTATTAAADRPAAADTATARPAADTAADRPAAAADPTVGGLAPGPVGAARRHAPPVMVRAHPQALPMPVDDLAVVDAEGDTSVATWTPPPAGAVMLRLLHRPPPPPGTILAAAGEELGAPVRTLGRDAPPDGSRVTLLRSDGSRVTPLQSATTAVPVPPSPDGSGVTPLRPDGSGVTPLQSAATAVPVPPSPDGSGVTLLRSDGSGVTPLQSAATAVPVPPSPDGSGVTLLRSDGSRVTPLQSAATAAPVPPSPDGSGVTPLQPDGSGVTPLQPDGSRVTPLQPDGSRVTPLQSTPAPAPISVRIRLPADGRRRWIVPLTVAGDLAAAGRAVKQDLRLPPVTDLHAEPRGRELRLTWTWPGTAGEARVLLRAGAPVDGPHDPHATAMLLSRAVFERQGCRLPAPPGVDLWCAVSLLARDGAREVHGPLVQRPVPVPAHVSYEIVRAGRGRRRIEVRGRAPLFGVEVRARAAHPPLRRDEGDVLVVLRPDGTDRMSAEFDLPPSRPLYLRAFAIDPPGPVELTCEHPDQLRVDRGRWW